MRHFTREEFITRAAVDFDWWPYMDPEILELVDDFREALGYRVSISPAPGAIGRSAGLSGTRHNVERWGQVMALDIFPEKVEPRRWVAVAREVGITGLGFYPDWRPQPGLHIDSRSTRHARVATWGGVRDKPGSRQRYVGLEAALLKWERNNEFV